ncbi:hypothetical protein HHL16_18040 [Pseudoflavitalea sp. G-6-1-2]|uniref:hypothetical protein n=1 Tax=Pseudoflavitalea sp. G-6-1-2 TaxID=2728841 RepID=UPI00146A371C|nr:hypothetical protein [Pseudoflavitalea sp. G-6-1-2]NML22791.1 hypothetical protein [Pseudoflavitalea sp. G-6-1-2]
MIVLDDAFWTLAESTVDLSQLTEKEKKELLKNSRMNYREDVRKRTLPPPTQEELIRGYHSLPDIIGSQKKISKKQQERDSLCFRAYMAVRKAYQKTEAELLQPA